MCMVILSLHAHLTEGGRVRIVHYNSLHSIQKHVRGCAGPCALKEDKGLSLKGGLDIKNSCNLSQMGQVNLEALRDVLKDQGYTGSGRFSGTGRGSGGGHVLVLEVFLAEGTAAATISFSKRVATVCVARLESGLPVPPHLHRRQNRNVTTANKSKTATVSLAWEAWVLEPPCLLHL